MMSNALVPTQHIVETGATFWWYCFQRLHSLWPYTLQGEGG